MDSWHTAAFLGLRAPPRELSNFELQTFFTFSAVKRSVIDECRHSAHPLELALHIGFLRMSGRSLIPSARCRHLCGATWVKCWIAMCLKQLPEVMLEIDAQTRFS